MFSSGSTSEGVLPQTITAYVGETVILPCRIDVNGELPTLEWSKKGLSPSNITLLYRHGCETFGMKNLAFLYRTNLLLNNLKDGNISLIIYNLKLSDGGTYHCRTLSGKQWEIHAILVLNMGKSQHYKWMQASKITSSIMLQSVFFFSPAFLAIKT